MTFSIEDIKKHAKSIVSSDDKTNYNIIIKLVNELGVSDEELNSESYWEENEPRQRFLLVSLLQVFKKLFEREDLTLKNLKSDEVRQFKTWCKKTYQLYKSKILSLISGITFETSITLDCLDSFMQLIELESIYFASNEDDAFFSNVTYRDLIVALWKSDLLDLETEGGQSANIVITEFCENYYKKYADVQYYFQHEFDKLLSEENGSFYKSSKSFGKWLTLVNHDQHCTNPEHSDELEVYVSNPPKVVEDLSKFKSLFEKNWLSMLGGELSTAQYKNVLIVLHKRLIPHFQNPTKLMDFLTDSYNVHIQNRTGSNDLLPILSLNGLFELMKKFNLEYPNFYQKLYQCLVPELMHIQYRSRFFRLIDLFLSSTHLSVHLVASFIKRLARLSLKSPPAAIVIIIPLIYNLLRKHPNCMVMIHNPRYIESAFASDEERAALKHLKNNYQDPFVEDEEDPELTNAINSSLWELATLMGHYHPNVATLAKIFSQPFKKLSYNMEDFLDWSYDSLLAAESKRKLKVAPVLEFEEFNQVFCSAENSDANGNTYVEGIDW